MNNTKSSYDSLAEQNYPVSNTTLHGQQSDVIDKDNILNAYIGNVSNLGDLLTPGNCSAKASLLPRDNPDQKCND